MLSKKGEKVAAAALMLGMLYKQEKGPLPKNLQQAAKWLCLASCLPGTDIANLKANRELEIMVNSKAWNESERKQILAGILGYANYTDKKRPYKVGRILGDVYSEGKLVELNLSEAFNWYEIAANLGSVRAMYRLGVLYQSELLGALNIDAAIKWFELAAEKGNPEAIKELVKLGKANDLKAELKNENNLTIEKQDKSEIILRKDPQIIYMLGKQYKEGHEGKVKDPVQAAFYFRKAAEKEHVEATFELAQLYASGELGKKARPVAVRFFKMAAKRKHLPAMNALINIYSEGNLTQADPHQVAKWQKRLESIKK